MFFKKKKSTEEAINDADKAVNKGLSGFLTKTFRGQEFGDQAKYGLDQAKKFSGQGNLAMTGMPAKAKVISIQDTGTLINNDPVVRLTLEVIPAYGAPFQVTGDSPVSKISVPRAGDEINIKYNATNTSEFVVV